MKAKKPLTDRTIAGAKPAPTGKRKLLWDAIVPGLALRVTDQGAKSFVLVTRYPGAPNPAPRTLGKYGAISLADARTKAQAWLKQIAAGVDPGVAEIQRKADTFKAISDEYFARRAKDHRSREWAQAALNRVAGSLAAKPIDSITRLDLIRLLDRIEEERGPVMSNRALGIITRIFNWHAARSDTFRSPVVRGMARPEAARQRILSDDELRAIWHACGDHPFHRMLRFILLTATRRGEAVNARRAEIAGGDWIIPAARYKTNHDHLIPLSSAAQAMIAELGKDWLFTLNGRSPIGDFQGQKIVIDEASGVTGWTLHDLRRTARSLMSRAGVPTDHAERCLGHVIGGVRGIYDRHEYHAEKARAFEALAGLIERIINPSETVVPIRR
jgi:integrase